MAILRLWDTRGGRVTWLTLTLHYSHKVQPSTTKRSAHEAGRGSTCRANKYFVALTIVAVSCSMLQQTINQKSLVQSVLVAWMHSHRRALIISRSWRKLFWLCSISFEKQVVEWKKWWPQLNVFETATYYFVAESAFKKAFTIMADNLPPCWTNFVKQTRNGSSKALHNTDMIMSEHCQKSRHILSYLIHRCFLLAVKNVSINTSLDIYNHKEVIWNLNQKCRDFRKTSELITLE